MGKQELLQEIKTVIIQNDAFGGEENEFLEIAVKCFKAGTQKPL